MSIHALHGLLRKKEVSSEEITRSVLRRIEAIEERVKAYVQVMPEAALAQAKAVDEEIARGNSISTLAGIPLALKDLLCTQGAATTCSSRILRNFIPPYDATVVRRLKEEKAVFLGKTNMDEFAMGSSTENSGFFTTRNPWDLDRVPGGSSGGSAAAVAAGEAIAALGSDTGGSIRQPASLCGVTGMKPTYGRVSRFGLVAFASSLDQIGPFSQDVEDCAVLLNAICGHDPQDSTSVNMAVPDFTRSLLPEVRGFRLGVPAEYFVEGMDPGVKASIEKAIGALEELGAGCEEVSLPHTEYAVAVYYLVATAEASSNLARYDGVKYGYRSPRPGDLLDMYSSTRAEGFGAEVKRRIMLGTYALSSGYYDAYYLKAQKVRTLIRQDFDQAFQRFDVLITPTAPTPAFRIGEKMDDPLQMYLSDIFTIPCNLAGLPGISIPCGLSKDGLPIGLQILGKPFDEAKVLRVAHAFQQATEWHRRRPAL
jgi:aspartyl-tRNA(Asn)/glutamyl-tRNA(Gln) amidotransferase subunit A